MLLDENQNSSPVKEPSSSTLGEYGAEQLPNFVCFPRKLFSTLEAFRSISNTRIDKVMTENNNDSVESESPVQEVREEEVSKNICKWRAAASRYLSMNDTPNTARDPEFSYDYETYMFQVHKNLTNIEEAKSPIETAGEEEEAFNLNEQEVQQMETMQKFGHISTKDYQEYMELPDDLRFLQIPEEKSKPIIDSTFGVKVLGISDSVLIRVSVLPSSDIRNAFKENGTYGFAPIYEVCMRSGPAMLFMTETTNCMNRLLSCSWAGCTPSFTAKVVDPYGNLSMTLTNSGVGCSCCLSSNKEFSVTLPSGELLGTICQSRDSRRHLLLTDCDTVIQAKGPIPSICSQVVNSLLSMVCNFCCLNCFLGGDEVFNFTEGKNSNKLVAKIRKIRTEVAIHSSDVRWLSKNKGDGFGKEDDDDNNNTRKKKKSKKKKDDTNDDDDDYWQPEDKQKNTVEYVKSHQVLVDFGQSLSLRKKSLILSAAFLIDFLYWQSSSDSYAYSHMQ